MKDLKENNNYIIYEDGKLFSKKRNKFLIPVKLPNGYLHYSINGTKLPIHRLLGTNFIDNPENLPCINHIDGNRTNNQLSNLEWCTFKDNTKNAIDRGSLNFAQTPINANNARKKFKEKTGLHTSAKLTQEQIVELYTLYKQGVDKKEIASKLNISIGHCRDLLRGRCYKELFQSFFKD